MVAANAAAPAWKTAPGFRIGLAGLAGLLILVFFEEIGMLIGTWIGSEEYSHGILIPFVTAFLIWQKKNAIAEMPFTGSWAGVAVAALGLALYFAGELATLYVITEYAFLTVLCGAALATTGPRAFREIGTALFLLAFAIPLPNFLYQGLSTKLQLISSQLGVSLIRLCDISVYLEGNVIDLGAYKLQVVEACSGLRYLFPLMSLAFICAFFFKAAFWKRAVVFLSSLPVAVFMNSVRVGVIGVLVEYRGPSMAEGFLHDFEGWAVFMACTAILIGEIWLLARIGKDDRPLREVFGIAFPEPLPADTPFRERRLPRQFWVVGGLLMAAAVLSSSAGKRQELIPPRAAFAEFPMMIDAWRGRREIMERQYVDVLKFDDYILADFSRDGAPPVNFYSAYYASQRKGESVHSPRSCIPGGGWQIKSLQTVPVPGVRLYGGELRVNRVLIQRGDERQLVYYWFQQRGRALTNEYLVKWYLFWDALTRNRSDGALVRLTTPAPEGENLARAEGRLGGFLASLIPRLNRYIAD